MRKKVRLIKAAQVITQVGNTEGQGVIYLKRETQVSIKIKQEMVTDKTKTHNLNILTVV